MSIHSKLARLAVSAEPKKGWPRTVEWANGYRAACRDIAEMIRLDEIEEMKKQSDYPKFNVEFGEMLVNTRCEYYLPVFPGIKFEIEAGTSATTYSNLLKLLRVIGNPTQVILQGWDDPILVLWRVDGVAKYHYIATGFSYGYLGSGSLYLAKFGVKAGFGKGDYAGNRDVGRRVAELYKDVSRLDKATTGILWGD